MKKILIFGCNGFVGQYLAKEFHENGYTVIATDCSECKEIIRPYISKYYRVDILDANAVEKLISKIQPSYIVNLAAISSVGASWSMPSITVDVNVNGSINILEAVKKYCSKAKILLVGSSEEYSISDNKINEEYPINANNPYGISKVTQEHFSKLYRDEFGLNIVNTRTFNHTGPGQQLQFAIPSFVKQVVDIEKNGSAGTLKVGNLFARRDIGDVRDMVQAYRAILEGESDKTIFNVGSGKCYLLEDIVKYIVSLSSQSINIVVDKDKIRPLDNPIIWCDNTRMKEEFNWEPKYDVFDAINGLYKSMME